MEDLRKEVGNKPLILVGSTVLVLNEKNEVLLQLRREPSNVWGLPGGLMELGESTEETAKRELYEETKIEAISLELINVYSGSYYYSKLKNGDEFYSVTTAYVCKEWTGSIVNNEEEGEALAFFRLDSLPEKVVGSHRRMVNDYVKHHANNLFVEE